MLMISYHTTQASRPSSRSSNDHEAAGRFDPQAGLLDESEVVGRIVVGGGQQLVAVKDRVGAGEEAQDLRLAVRGIRRPADSRTNDVGIMIRAVATMRTRSSGSTGWLVLQRRARHGDQRVDRHALRDADRAWRASWSRRARSSMVSPMPIMPPQQTCDAGVAHVGERIQAVLIGPRGDDLAVELRRGIEIVVVGGEAGLGEAVGLLLASACPA